MKTIFTISFLFSSILIMLSCGKSDNSTPVTPAKSSEKQITDFRFANLSPVVSASIDQTTHNIGASVAGNLTALTPTIATSSKATVSPASGVVQNFTSPVVYTVTAEDGSIQTYQVTLTSAAKPLVAVSINDSLRSTMTQLTGRNWNDVTKDSVAVLSDGGIKRTLTTQEVQNAKTVKYYRLVDFTAKGRTYQQWYSDLTANGQIIVVYYIVGRSVEMIWVPQAKVQIANNDLHFTGSGDFQLYYGPTSIQL